MTDKEEIQNNLMNLPILPYFIGKKYYLLSLNPDSLSSRLKSDPSYSNMADAYACLLESDEKYVFFSRSYFTDVFVDFEEILRFIQNLNCEETESLLAQTKRYRQYEEKYRTKMACEKI